MPPKDKKKDKKKDEIPDPEEYAAHRKIRREKEEDANVHIGNRPEGLTSIGKQLVDKSKISMSVLSRHFRHNHLWGKKWQEIIRQTEQYFQCLNTVHKKWPGYSGMEARKEHLEKAREYKLRQKWLVNFSAHVAYRLCDYIAKGQKEMLVSNRLRSIADVVLERVAEILGEPKPTRMNPARLARFMVAISDRIAVWIENAVYRADALEPIEFGGNLDEHMRLDNEKSLIC